MPLHFLQLYQSALGELIAEWPGRSSGVCAHVCFSLWVHPSVVDVPPCEGANPLILNRADVLAHHSVSSALVSPGSLLLNLGASANAAASPLLCASDCFPNEALKAVKSYTQ